LYDSGFTKRGGTLICTYFDENFLNLVPAGHVEGLYSCLDFYEGISDPFSRQLLKRYNERFPGDVKLTAGSACSGTYRGLKLWEAAVTEAGSLKQEDVIKALDHARISEGPGGPAEMVPGQHHPRLNMYVARARNGNFEWLRISELSIPRRIRQLSGKHARRTKSHECNRRTDIAARALPGESLKLAAARQADR